MPTINIPFPLDDEAVSTPEQYVRVFSSKASQLSSNKQICLSLTLTCGDASALEGLRVYLQQSPLFFSTKLIINLDPSAFLGDSLQETLKLIADKGVTAVTFISKEANKPAALKLLETVKADKISIDIKLWEGVDAIQQELNQCISIFQREKRIAGFRQSKPALKHIEDRDKPKRTRKKNTAPVIDTDAELEVQVEIAVEVAVEIAIEEQHEDIGTSEYINRDEFVRRAKERKFKIDPSYYASLEGKEYKTWDRWMGNIYQAVVSPAKKRKKVGIIIGDMGDIFSRTQERAKKEGFDYWYSINYVADIPLIFFAYYAPNSNKPTYFNLELDNRSFIDQLITDQLIPEKIKRKHDDYRSIELSDVQWEAARPKEYPHLYKACPLYNIDETELWKGEYIIDADALDETETALEELKRSYAIPFKNHFKNPEVSLRFYPNPKNNLMTPEACEQLLAHQAQLHYGLDFAHLPAGFELNEVLEGEKIVSVLHFNEDKARIQSNDPYAIKLSNIEPIRPLSDDLFNQWRLSAVDSQLLQKYKALEETFDWDQIADFKRYLPVMLQLTPDLLTAFGHEAKDFIHAAIHYKKYPSSIKGILESHLLMLFLKNDADTEIMEALKHWHTQLDLTASDLNGLLAVYNSYGSKGLAALFSIWENACIQIEGKSRDDSLLKDLKQYYFPHCDSFDPLLEPSFEQAMDVVRELPQNKRKFWDILFKQHMSAVGYDALPPLVEAFQHFCTQVEKKHLIFSEDCHFSQVKNLQVALSRMISILDKTHPIDVPLIWKQITSLDLGSTGAIRLLNDQTAISSQGQLLLPEMEVSSTHYSETHDYKLIPLLLPEHGYQSLQVTHTKPGTVRGAEDMHNLYQVISYSKSPEELKKNYYRHLSSQEHRLSLDFYQKATEIIDKATNNFEIRAGFYALIAATTSGFKAKAGIENEDLVLKSLATFLKSFKGSNLLSILRLFLKKLVPMGPFTYVMELMIAMVNKSYSDIFFISRDFGGAKSLLETISDISTTDDYAFYDGIKFINLNQMNYEEHSKFVNLAVQIDSGGYLRAQGIRIHGRDTPAAQASLDGIETYIDPDNANIRASMIRLMSTFQLDKEILDKIKTYIELDKEFKHLLFNCLSLLSQMKYNNKPKLLTQTDLIHFISELQLKYSQQKSDSLKDTFIIECVQKEFGSYFSDDFFINLTSPDLSPAIKDKIQDHFDTLEEQNLVIKVLLSFKELKDKLFHENALGLLILISKRLEIDQRIEFLKLLGSINIHHENTLSELITLLNAIGDRGKIDDFTFIMEFAQKEKAANLIPKITLYYRQALPFLYGKKREHLTIADLQPLAAKMVLNTKETPKEFKTSFMTVIDELEKEVIACCPNEKQAILTLLSQFISEAKNKEGFDLRLFVKFLGQAGQRLGSSDIIRSLSIHYHSKPLELYSLLDMIKNPEEWDQFSILIMTTSLLNNGRPCELKVIEKFLELCGSKKSELFQLSTSFFKCPPYPTFEQINDWHNMYKDDSDYKDKMEHTYQQYSKEPCKREAENAFTLKEAKKLAPGFQGISFEESELQNMDRLIREVKEKPTEVLKQSLKELRSSINPEERNSEILAIVAELLYRSKGSSGGKGHSFELNSVQYLAVLAFLKSKGHMTAEMATGEGKSRTMMISIACQFVLGKTVDFVTSDMQLARRDYLEYQAFFKLLGAETRLISASSAPSAYQCQGINFSDASNLNLFRNKVLSKGKGLINVIEPDPTKRALLLDEADRTYFDISETRFNYSDLPKDSKIKNMEWIYPFLIRFFNESDSKLKAQRTALYEEDIDGCTRAFIRFVKAELNGDEVKLAQLEGESLSQAQLECWQEAAVMALNLKLGTDYALEPNVLIETTHGPKLATEARLIYGNRLSKNSKFSFGVHQCLHAFLNMELQKPNSVTSLKCTELACLKNKEIDPSQVIIQPFFIHPEKQIVYSSTSKSFLDNYRSGDLWAITGTSGAILEQEEAAGLYETDTHAMEFITVPRKHELKRIDHSLRLAGDFKQRVAAILEYIDEARQSGRPVLLICEDDTQASLIRDALKDLLSKKPENKRIPEDQWQFIDSNTSSKEEQSIIERAGKPAVLTIATSRLGRGTDIQLDDPLKNAGGLRVITSYLPRERDQWQIFGRSGRYGDEGDTRLVVDKQQLVKLLGKKDLETDFFLSNEFYIQSKQARMDKDKQIERLIRHSLSDFRMKITDTFFKYYDESRLKRDVLNNKSAIDSWAECTKKMDQLWNQVWPELDSLVKQPEVNIPQIKAKLAQFKEQAQRAWEELHRAPGICAEGLPKKLDDLKLNSRTEHLLRMILPKRRYSYEDRTQVYKAYDKALDGRAVIYDELFSEFKATWRGDRRLFANTRAWWEGHGILFADTRAILAGKRPIFANLRAWMNKDKEAKNKQQIQCHDLLKALEQNNSEELQHFLQHQNATQLLEPEAGDLLLSYKIQLIESILNYAHSQLEQKGKVAKKDMSLIRKLLILIKDTRGDKPLPLKAMIEKLKPLKNGFFDHPLKKDINAIINQREQEEKEEKNLGKKDS